MKAIKIHKDILNLRHCVSTDPTRAALNGIKITQKDGYQSGYATDGYCLITDIVPISDQENFELLLKPIKIKKRLNEIITFHCSEDNLWQDDNNNKLEDISSYLDSYPNTGIITDSYYGHHVESITINPTLLMNLAKSLQLEPYEGLTIEYDRHKPEKIMRIVASHDDSSESSYQTFLANMKKN